jgi:homoserine kinase
MTAPFVRVPATSANIGPGFDAVGLALTLYADIGLVTTDGQIPDKAHRADEHHLASVAFRRAGGDGALWVRSPIPMGRGLGYSAAVRVGGLLAAHLQRHGSGDEALTTAKRELLDLATELEGHPDNVAPALLGGLVVSAGGVAVRVPLGFEPTVVCWVPSSSTNTDHSRAKLSASVLWNDAVFNIGRAAMTVAAFAAGDVGALRVATQDRLHQSQRFDQSPASLRAYDAALDAGAWAAWLSGSGPTVAAMCSHEAAQALANALPTDGHTKILQIDPVGAQFV